MSRGIASLEQAAGQAPSVSELIGLLRDAQPVLTEQHAKGRRACARLAGRAEVVYGTLYDLLSNAGLGHICPDWETHSHQGPFASLLALHDALTEVPAEHRLLMAN